MLKVSEVALRLNLSPSKVYELIDDGELAHHRIGGAIRVSEEQLAEFLDETKRDRRESRRRRSQPRPPPLRHVHL